MNADGESKTENAIPAGLIPAVSRAFQNPLENRGDFLNCQNRRVFWGFGATRIPAGRSRTKNRGVFGEGRFYVSPPFQKYPRFFHCEKSFRTAASLGFADKTRRKSANPYALPRFPVSTLSTIPISQYTSPRNCSASKSPLRTSRIRSHSTTVPRFPSFYQSIRSTFAAVAAPGRESARFPRLPRQKARDSN